MFALVAPLHGGAAQVKHVLSANAVGACASGLHHAPDQCLEKRHDPQLSGL
jgi:hypothetical protein